MSRCNPDSESRRQFLKTALVVAVATVAGGVVPKLRAAGDEPHLTVADPTAKAMDYIEDAAASKNPLCKPGSICANCQLYSGPATGYGSCQLFPGKQVNARGWCTSYTRKAS
jgi:High potential iron-sulfur protein/TAT (twin-arginine translocation) pathway signal sequence